MKSFKAYKFTTFGGTSFRGEIDYSSCTSFNCIGELKMFKNGFHFGSNVINALDVCPTDISRKNVKLYEIEVFNDCTQCETRSGFYGVGRTIKFIKEIPYDNMIDMLSKEIIDLEKKMYSDSSNWQFNMLYIFGKLFRKPLNYSYADKDSAFAKGETAIINSILSDKFTGKSWSTWWKMIWESDVFTNWEKWNIQNMMDLEYLFITTNVEDIKKVIKVSYTVISDTTTNRPYKISAKNKSIKKPKKREMKKKKKKSGKRRGSNVKKINIKE